MSYYLRVLCLKFGLAVTHLSACSCLMWVPEGGCGWNIGPTVFVWWKVLCMTGGLVLLGKRLQGYPRHKKNQEKKALCMIFWLLIYACGGRADLLIEIRCSWEFTCPYDVVHLSIWIIKWLPVDAGIKNFHVSFESHAVSCSSWSMYLWRT